MEKTARTNRFIEIDFSRGVLCILMAAYHIVYDLSAFKLWELDLYSGFAWLAPRIIAFGFVFLSGLSAYLRQKGPAAKRRWGKREALLAACALAISAVTYVAFGSQRFIFFGILHLLAFCALVAPLMARLGRHNLALGLFVVAAGLLLGRQRFDFPWLAWLGLRPAGLFPVDYLPLLPWFGWFLIGIGAGSFLYPGDRRGSLTGVFDRLASKAPIVRGMAFLGRHSLVFYLVHLPSIYGIVYLVATYLVP